MRILIADNGACRVSGTQMIAKLARYGSVDVVQNGRDAVLAYVNNGSRGVSYDLVILDQHLRVLDAFEAVAMIRAYESEHKMCDEFVTVCVVSGDEYTQQQYETHCAQDERIHLLREPVNLDFVESLAGSVAAGLGKQCTFHTKARRREEDQFLPSGHLTV